MGIPSRVMNAKEASTQVTHMRDFILHEAKEKADEIAAKAEQDYIVEKQRLVEEEKLRIKKEFERRESNVALETKIANATETNKNKMLVLQAAAGQIEEVYNAAFEQMKRSNIATDQTLLKGLIEEAIRMIQLDSVTVRCRAEDKAAVQQAIASCSGAKITLDSTPITVDPSVTNISNACIGGVLVFSDDGKVVVSQSLNARLQVAYDTALPVIKPVLFNQGGSKHTC